MSRLRGPGPSLSPRDVPLSYQVAQRLLVFFRLRPWLVGGAWVVGLGLVGLVVEDLGGGGRRRWRPRRRRRRRARAVATLGGPWEPGAPPPPRREREAPASPLGPPRLSRSRRPPSSPLSDRERRHFPSAAPRPPPIPLNPWRSSRRLRGLPVRASRAAESEKALDLHPSPPASLEPWGRVTPLPSASQTEGPSPAPASPSSRAAHSSSSPTRQLASGSGSSDAGRRRSVRLAGPRGPRASSPSSRGPAGPSEAGAPPPPPPPLYRSRPLRRLGVLAPPPPSPT